jgi:hypothetical protein
MENSSYKDYIPELDVDGNNIVSDRCIWCGFRGELSKSHVIPESLGGWYAPLISCEKCNNYLGRQYEAEVMHNAYITAALSKLNMKTPENAYKLGKKIDPSTGVEMWLKQGGIAKPIPKKIDENTFLGSNEDAIDFWVKRLKKERPNWPAEPIIEFISDPSRKVLRYAGDEYRKDNVRKGKAKIKQQFFCKKGWGSF